MTAARATPTPSRSSLDGDVLETVRASKHGVKIRGDAFHGHHERCQGIDEQAGGGCALMYIYPGKDPSES